MDRALLMIAGILFVVALVGFMTISGGFHSPTGNVVSESSNTCDACVGDWVCAAKNGVVSNYPSACAASCDDAHVIYDAVCERIPHASK